jgi:CRISPR system Cascade subunit CasB
MDREGKPRGRGGAFIDAILPRLKTDSGFAAALSRADNPATEYQAWEHLVRYGCDIENTKERLAFSTVAAAIARAKPERDGQLDIANAVARCFEDGHKSDAARGKIRRLLACTDTEEACQITRPILSLVRARGAPISYGRLLDDLLFFGERVKLSWAKSFYRTPGGEG